MASPPSQPEGKEDDDPFAPLLSLESSFYDEGYALGVTEGSTSGRIEGRLFGLSRGFEKFEEMGRLQGQAQVWSLRLEKSEATSPKSPELDEQSSAVLVPIKGGERLKKQVRKLVELTDPEAVSTENSEDGVADFDERLREAKAKGVVISRMLGESASLGEPRSATVTKASGEMEDFGGVMKGKTKS